MGTSFERTPLEFYANLSVKNPTKIVLLVLDGLAGLPKEEGDLTELESANTPNLDKLASKSICGLHTPVGPGIIPGSGPAHLGLFGYDPIRYQVGRGVLSALGTGFDLQSNDVAARGNFCTVDDDGVVTDRRAGRIPTEKNEEICKLLRDIKIPGVELFISTVKEYRALFVLRGEKLSGEISATDPQAVGLKPLPAKAMKPDAELTAKLVNQFLQEARKKLVNQHPANMLLLRGFSKHPDWPNFEEVFNVRAAAIAAYPMYRGVAKLVGMTALDAGQTVESEFETLEKNWDKFDFFFVHIKKTDSYGEDGNFEKKVGLIEKIDAMIPRLLNMNPDVLWVTGDHSTPAIMKSHGFQPVPTMIWSRLCRPDSVQAFGERACITGGLGPRIPSHHLLPIAMANAGRLEKFGA